MSFNFFEFIYDFATEADCSIFDRMVQNREKLIKIKGEEVFKNKAVKACDATVEKAFKSSDWLVGTFALSKTEAKTF